jgi:polysaccharide export outer membrane protein
MSAEDPKPSDLVASDADYVIGKNDLISVTINDLVAPNVETTKTTRVSESGNISLPLIGQIKAAGLTEAELEAAVADAYAKAKIIDKAQVSVTVNEARGRAFSILGAVGAPGQYAIVNSDFRVLDALVLARDTAQGGGVDYMYIIRKVDNTGGAAPVAPRPTAPSGTTKPAGGGSDVFEPRGEAKPFTQPVLLQTSSERITTPAGAGRPAGQQNTFGGFQAAGPQSDKRVIRIPLIPLRNGDLRYNVVIRPQDMVIVPQPTVGEYYMGGHVARVGVYSLTGRKITLKQAVVSAGMLDQVAIPQRTDVIRRIGPDQEVTVRIDLAKIFAGEQSDLYLKPNDIVQVGTNAIAPFLAAIRGGFRFTYGFGFLYDKNFNTDNNNN